MDIQKSIRMAVDTGNVLLGKNECIRSVRSGNSKIVLFSSNIPHDLKITISKYAKMSSIPTYDFSGSSKELGSVCGKPYPVSVMSVLEEGDSDILSLISLNASSKKVS